MLGSTVKRLDRAVDFAISSDLDGFHPQGKHRHRDRTQRGWPRRQPSCGASMDSCGLSL